MAVVRYEGFLGEGVIAFSSDAGIDFRQGVPADSSRFSPTEVQQQWLAAQQIPAADRLIFPRQVHGQEIWQADRKDASGCGQREADAVVTRVPGLAVAVRTADCLPVLIHDPRRQVVAAVHAGWKGTRQKILSGVIARMVADHGVDPREIKVILGPCIRRESYEVGEEFRDYFPRETRRVSGRLFFDIVLANLHQLLEAGVSPSAVMDCGLDTFADRRFHSFRRDGDKAGRMIHVIMIKKEAFTHEGEMK